MVSLSLSAEFLFKRNSSAGLMQELWGELSVCLILLSMENRLVQSSLASLLV